MVVAVGRSHGKRQRHSSGIDQQGSLHALLAAVPRVAPHHFTARERGFRQAAIDRQPPPVDPPHLVVAPGGHAPETTKEAGCDPLLEAAMRRRARAQIRRIQRLPLTPRSQHEENRLQHTPVRHTWPSAA